LSGEFIARTKWTEEFIVDETINLGTNRWYYYYYGNSEYVFIYIYIYIKILLWQRFPVHTLPGCMQVRGNEISNYYKDGWREAIERRNLFDFRSRESRKLFTTIIVKVALINSAALAGLFVILLILLSAGG